MFKNKNGLTRKEIKQKEREEYEKRVMNYNNVVAIELANRNKPKSSPKDSFVSIQKVNKIYDNLVQAVFDFSLDIKKNEFIVFVGPSGCGKSTVLRMIAGLEEITSGNLFIDGQYANSLPPKDRSIAMVFQSYALYPHMSVYDNMAFSMRIKETLVPVLDENGNQVYGPDKTKIEEINKELEGFYKKKEEFSNIEKLEDELNILKDEIKKIKDENPNLIKNKELKFKEKEEHKLTSKLYEAKLELKDINEKIALLEENLKETENTNVPQFISRKLNKEEIDERVNEASKILQIEEYLDRKPKALSGGQRQRVALGRAICKRAKLFLMDEPLSNLDAKLRVSMRSEIIRIHKKIGATTIYVTHDQTEAMTMADRIVIMKKGVIQQIGKPKDIYNHPANIFVATFIGSPSMNIINTKIIDNKIKFDDDNVLNLDSSLVDKLVLIIKEKLAKINYFIENGKEQEYEKSLNAKREEFKLNANKKGYKFEFDENDQLIDPLSSISLDDYEKSICDRIYEDKLTEAIKAKEHYEKLLETKEYEIKFGIRPENVFIENNYVEENIKASNKLTLKITIPELLGNEYYLHSSLQNHDFIFKASANNELKENDTIKVVFDLNKVHIFDTVDAEILL